MPEPSGRLVGERPITSWSWQANYPGGKKLLQQHPFDQILDGGFILGADDLMLFLGAVLKLDLVDGRDVLDAFCPAKVRGDSGFGNEGVLLELESRDQRYLLRLRQTANVQRLVAQQFARQDWSRADL